MAKKTSTSTYQPGRNIEDIQKTYGLKNVIKLASNENPLGPSKKAISAANKMINSMNRYPDSQSSHLKQAINKLISKRNISVFVCAINFEQLNNTNKFSTIYVYRFKSMK